MVTAGIQVSGPAAGPSGEAKEKLKLLQSTGFTLGIQSKDSMHTTKDQTILSLTGRLTSEEGAEHFANGKGAEHSANDKVEDPIQPFKIANMAV